MNKIHNISEVHFENEFMIIRVDGKMLKLNVSEISKRLAIASLEDKNEFSISPSGYGIHWHKIDEDISIEGLLNNQ